MVAFSDQCSNKIASRSTLGHSSYQHQQGLALAMSNEVPLAVENPAFGASSFTRRKKRVCSFASSHIAERVIHKSGYNVDLN